MIRNKRAAGFGAILAAILILIAGCSLSAERSAAPEPGNGAPSVTTDAVVSKPDGPAPDTAPAPTPQPVPQTDAPMGAAWGVATDPNTYAIWVHGANGLKQVTTAKAPDGIHNSYNKAVLSPDGQRVAFIPDFTGTFGSHLVVVTLDGKMLVASGPEMDRVLGASPDGAALYITYILDRGKQIWPQSFGQLHVATGKVTPIFESSASGNFYGDFEMVTAGGEKGYGWFAISPNCRYIAFNREDGIRIADGDGTGASRLLTTGQSYPWTIYSITDQGEVWLSSNVAGFFKMTPGRVKAQAPAWSNCMTMRAPLHAVSKDAGLGFPSSRIMANKSSKNTNRTPFLRQKNESGWCILVIEPRGQCPRKGVLVDEDHHRVDAACADLGRADPRDLCTRRYSISGS